MKPTNSAKTAPSLIALGVATLLVGGLAGCTSEEDVSFNAISGNLTPNMQTSSQRSIDVDRSLATYKDQSWRMFWDDLGRTFYTDQPSRLTAYPGANPSGVPR
jgi:hypothetical protein